MAAKPKKSSKAVEMKEMRVTFAKSPKKAASRKVKKNKMSFHQWVAHYLKASGGNPV